MPYNSFLGVGAVLKMPANRIQQVKAVKDKYKGAYAATVMSDVTVVAVVRGRDGSIEKLLCTHADFVGVSLSCKAGNVTIMRAAPVGSRINDAVSAVTYCMVYWGCGCAPMCAGAVLLVHVPI